MQPHHEPTRHRHPNCDEILHVISGRIEHSLGDQFFELGPGDTISIPAGVWHGARVLGEAPAEMTISFSSADRQTEFEQTADQMLDATRSRPAGRLAPEDQKSFLDDFRQYRGSICLPMP